MDVDPSLCDTTVRVNFLRADAVHCAERTTSPLKIRDASKRRKHGMSPRPKGGRDSEGGPASASTTYRSYNFDAVAYCLASSSKFFRAALERWCGQGSKKLVELQVEDGELEAIRILLEFIHCKRLPIDVPGDRLVTLLSLADRYMVDECVPVICKSLMRGYLSWEEALNILETCWGSRISRLPGVRGLLEMADRAVLGKFPDLEAVPRTGDVWKYLMDLPLAAIRSLLMNDCLKVGAEETVFCAVSFWLDKRFGTARLDEEAYQEAGYELGSCIRFPQMSASYLRHIVPMARWVRDLNLCVAWVSEALDFHILSDNQKSNVKNQVCFRDQRFFPRQVSPAPRVLAVIKASPETFKQDLLSSSLMCRTTVLYKGYSWKFQCNLTKDGLSDSGISIGLYADNPFPEALQQHDLLAEQVELPSSVGIKNVAIEATIASGVHRELLETPTWTIGWGFSVDDFFKVPLQSLTAPGSKFVVDGYITIKAIIG